MSPEPRPELEDLQPYASSDTGGGRVFLHANENPYPLPAEIKAEILDGTSKLELNRYPDPDPRELREAIASYVGVDPSWIWIGDGSNEVLLQACLAYGGPGRTALLFEPTYVMHQRQARMAGTGVRVVARGDDFSISAPDALEAIASIDPHIIFVCSPNNPTGTVTPLEDIRKIAEATSGLVLVDEAYFEFSRQTLVPQLDELPNVVVVRTLSKAFRLAGVRLGYGVASPDVVEVLGRVRMPYAQSSFTQMAATVVVRRGEAVLSVVERIIGERDRIATALAAFPGVEVFPSGANFVFFRHARAAELVSRLAEQGIVVRDFSHLPRCDNCLRVTAGTPAENEEFLEVAATFS